MHQYKIVITNYTESGALGSLYAIKYADNAEEAKLICDDFSSQKQVIVNEDGETVETSLKRYKVELYLLCYKLCQDQNAFFSQWQA